MGWVTQAVALGATGSSDHEGFDANAGFIDEYYYVEEVEGEYDFEVELDYDDAELDEGEDEGEEVSSSQVSSWQPSSQDQQQQGAGSLQGSDDDI